jgi:predicted enzyme related to lactoylglutathione lyase
MPTIVHFDISADDINRARKFYENTFGWKISVMEGFPDYYEIATTDLQGEEGIGGGITRRQYPQQSGITEFIGVHSIEETVTRVTRSGGKVLQPKQAIPGYGYLALCIDTENNVFGLFEDDKNAGAEMVTAEETDKYKTIKEQQTKL